MNGLRLPSRKLTLSNSIHIAPMDCDSATGAAAHGKKGKEGPSGGTKTQNLFPSRFLSKRILTADRLRFALHLMIILIFSSFTGGVGADEAVSGISSNSRSAAKIFCSTFEECRALHLNRTLGILSQHRCHHIERLTHRKERLLTFTHIAKAGGTTVEQYASGHFHNRFDRPTAHEFYGSVEARSNETRILFTVFREPIARSVSMFNWIQNHQDGQSNAIWQFGQKKTTELKDFLAREDCLNFLIRRPLEMFDTTRSVKATLPEPSARQVHKYRQQLAYGPAIIGAPLTENQFIAHTLHDDTPTEFQCIDALKVAYLWTIRYSAVGQTENMAPMWRVLSARADLPSIDADEAAGTKSNPTKVSDSKLDEQLKVARSVLTEKLQCHTFLYEFAGQLAKFDETCPHVLHFQQQQQRQQQQQQQQPLLSSS